MREASFATWMFCSTKLLFTPQPSLFLGRYPLTIATVLLRAAAGS
jgi:hypothetical protein